MLKFLKNIFQKKIIVIKFGGSLFSYEDNRKKFWLDIKNLINLNYRIVIVHGGGKEISFWLDKCGIKTKFIDGLRYTDKNTLEIVEMVLSGKINKKLVSELNSIDVKAIGFSGRDYNFVKSKRIKKFGFVGEPYFVNTKFLNFLLNKKIVLILSPISSDDNSNALNINADDFANIIAIKLKAKKLIFLTDQNGVLQNINDENSVINILTKNKIDDYINKGIITDGMIPKIKSAFKAIEKGVKEVCIINGKKFGIIEKFFDKKYENKIGTRIKNE